MLTQKVIHLNYATGIPQLACLSGPMLNEHSVRKPLQSHRPSQVGVNFPNLGSTWEAHYLQQVNVSGVTKTGQWRPRSLSN